MFSRQPNAEALQAARRAMSFQAAPKDADSPPPLPGSWAAAWKEVAATQAKPSNEDGIVVIGKGTRVEGKIDDCHKLEVLGQLEASVLTGTLVIREGGAMKGVIQCQNAQIEGTFEGTLFVTEQLTVHATGRVVGEVSYRTLAMEVGARLQGHIVCAEAPPAPAAQAPPPLAERPERMVPLNGAAGHETSVTFAPRQFAQSTPAHD